MRLLLLFLAIWIAAFLIRQMLRRRLPPSAEPTTTGTVQCARCGVHLPAARAIQHVNGHHYCSISHARDDE